LGKSISHARFQSAPKKRLVTESLEIEIASLPDILSRAHAKKKIRNCYVLLQIVVCSVLKGPSGDFSQNLLSLHKAVILFSRQHSENL